MSSYPTLEEVNAASHYRLGEWYRFLRSPGMDAVGRPEFRETLQREKVIMDRIVERFRELGGFTPTLSKAVGWRTAS